MHKFALEDLCMYASVSKCVPACIRVCIFAIAHKCLNIEMFGSKRSRDSTCLTPDMVKRLCIEHVDEASLNRVRLALQEEPPRKVALFHYRWPKPNEKGIVKQAFDREALFAHRKLVLAMMLVAPIFSKQELIL